MATTRSDGSDFSRLAGADVHIVHSRLYFVELQGVASWTRDLSGTHRGTLMQAVWDRTGTNWGFHLSGEAVAPDFQAAAGFVNRTGIVDLSYFNRFTGYGSRGALIETWSAFQRFDRLWKYDGFARQSPFEGSENYSFQATLRGWWQPNLSFGRQAFGFDANSIGYQGQPYGAYRVGKTGPGTDPFTIPPALTDLWSVTGGLTTPTWRQFTGTVSVGGGATAIFEEAARGTYTSMSGQIDLRPTRALRISGQYSRLVLHRRDGSWFSSEDIPRLKVEYQATLSIFFRVVGQYTDLSSDALKDPTTGGPILIGGSAVGPSASKLLRVDWLFSFRPSPGTLVYLGYGASCSEFDARCAVGRQASRLSDGFFAKVSYLFGL